MNPGRELDALVAEKVMGLCFHEWHVAYHGYEPPLTGWTATCGKCGAVKRDPDGDSSPPADWNEPRPSYSTEIAAAMDVWESLRNRGSIRQIRLTGYNPDEWFCDMATFLGEPGTDAITAEGRSAPHAICLAALAAVGAASPPPGAPQ